MRPMGEKRVEVKQCSVCDAGTELVVNASNDSATLGGGVSRALSEECGGKLLQEEMRVRLEEEFDGALEEGDCLVTSAGSSTRFRYVLHVPSVDYRGNKAELVGGRALRTVTSPERVRACVEAALESATEIGRRDGCPISITFPLLGAGSGGLSPARAGAVMLSAMKAYFDDHPDAAIEKVVIAIPDSSTYELCTRLRSQ